MENNNQTEFCPDNHLVWAILCTVFCCLPLGIVSIIKSTSVERLWKEGRHEEARMAARSAANYAKWGAIIAAISLAMYLIFIIVAGAAGAGFLSALS